MSGWANWWANNRPRAQRATSRMLRTTFGAVRDREVTVLTVGRLMVIWERHP